jgi:hypothetical protein
MKREWTNKIRFVLDELIPPLIRDNKLFMWVFFVGAYGTFKVASYMNFKSRAYSMNDKEYAEFYGSLGNSVSRRRTTDLNSASISAIRSAIPKEKNLSLLDVGYGNGFLIEQLSGLSEWSRIAGVDVVPPTSENNKFQSYTGAVPNLPFPNKHFDIVTCTHVMEHVLDTASSAKELIRIATTMIIVVVPRQRYYYYTLDEHLNFYPRPEPLAKLFAPFPVTTSLEDGDWVLIVDLREKLN